MSNLQTRFSLRTNKLKRKLIDNILTRKGWRVSAIRTQVVENRYGDRSIIAVDPIITNGVINIPGQEIPLYRAIRQNDSGGFYQNQETPKSNASVYDLLPIEGFFPNTAKIERDDILIMRLLDNPSGTSPDVDGENHKKTWNLFPLQVTDLLGLFDSTTLMYTKVILAPYAFYIKDFSNINDILNQLLQIDNTETV